MKPLSLPFHERLLAATAPARERFLATPILQRALRGDIDRDDYLTFLGQAYHHVRHTVPLLMSCGCRLGERHDWLRSAIGVYVDEEMGHEEWILDDIAAAGGDPQAAAEAPPLPATELMVAYAYDVIHDAIRSASSAWCWCWKAPAWPSHRGRPPCFGSA